VYKNQTSQSQLLLGQHSLRSNMQNSTFHTISSTADDYWISVSENADGTDISPTLTQKKFQPVILLNRPRFS